MLLLIPVRCWRPARLLRAPLGPAPDLAMARTGSGMWGIICDICGEKPRKGQWGLYAKIHNFYVYVHLWKDLLVVLHDADIKSDR